LNVAQSAIGVALLIALSSPANNLAAESPARCAEGSNTISYAFETDSAEHPPKGFTFSKLGNGASGRWLVRAEKDAPSKPNVLAQVDTDKDSDRVLIAVADQPSFGDVRAHVRCKMISGRVEQSCGLVFRYKDESNYMLIRANALEGSLRLYAYRDGRRYLLESFSGAVTGGVWHELRVAAKADQIEVDWDGERVLKGRAKDSAAVGRAGVWTQADSVTYFDDLIIAGI
jgi:hypothetical protein